MDETDDYQLGLNKTEDSIEKLIWIHDYALKIQTENPLKAIGIFEDAIQIGERLVQQDTEVIPVLLNSYEARAALYFLTGNYGQVITCVYRALPLLMKQYDQNFHGRLLSTLAQANFSLGNTEEGFQFSWQALENFKSAGDDLWLADIYNHLGYQYLSMEHFEWAERYFFQAVDQLKNVQDKNKIYAEIYNNFCQLYLEMDQPQKALDYGEIATGTFKSMHDYLGLADAYLNMGQVYQKIRDHVRAKEAFESGLTLTQKYNLRFQNLKALIRLSEIALESHDFSTALAYLHEGFSLADGINAKRLMYKMHRLFSRIYKQQGEFALSLEHFEQFYLLEKQVLNEKETQRIKSLEIIHQIDAVQKDAETYRKRSKVLEKQLGEQQKLQQDLEKKALTDPLTGLFNRHHFNQMINQGITWMEDPERKTSILMIDLDHFKLVNDQHGHLIGDQVLKHVAGIMQEELRQMDYLWRIGGEEFVILLPKTDEERALLVAERIRQRIAGASINLDGGVNVNLTLSVGIACSQAAGASLLELFQQADQALYQAKSDGRNRVVIG